MCVCGDQISVNFYINVTFILKTEFKEKCVILAFILKLFIAGLMEALSVVTVTKYFILKLCCRINGRAFCFNCWLIFYFETLFQE